MTFVHLMGGVAAVFALLLLGLPAARVAQGKLEARQAAGLWISGGGFLLLALAAFVLKGEAASGAVLAGVTAAVVGNIVQRRATRPGPR